MESRLSNQYRSVIRILRAAKPALVIVVDKKGVSNHGRPQRLLADAGAPESDAASPRVSLTGEAAVHFYAALKPGPMATASVHIAAPHRTPAMLRNVIGVLRGSDPALRDTYVLLTAHYDHLGMRPDGPGDRIYNGANDDGSGTVSVMEVARALAQLPKHPRRSIVFMTFFGEEKGLIGSEYYAHHPVFPLAKTIADLNLEQVGRTDSTVGPQISNGSLTGFDYSDLTKYMQQAGERTGIKIYKNAQGSDNYFSQSDNFSFAEAGVPAETLCVAFEFPDYHAVGDEWQKIDYDNMAKVDRAIALAMFLMADSEQPVEWNEANPKTAPFVKASKQLGLE
jgi:Zn-dependent M28 family amino/carboxypeptidase